MGSTDQNGRPEQVLSRRNTFQRMLELERKNKVNRMQASPTAGPPAARTSMARDSNHQHHHDMRPSTLKSTGRAMTSPALSLPIPPAKVSFNATTTKYIISNDGDVVPQEEEKSEEDSNASSICHSPGWENSSSKKRRKEKQEARERKKKEKAKSEADAAKQDQKAKTRLSKPPPSHKRFSKLAVNLDRSVSEPVVPVVQPSPEVQEVKEERKKDPVSRSRRGSFDVGLKTFIQVKNAISVPWKSSSSNGTPVQTTPTQEIAPPSTSFSKATGGFIGGLKLRQAEEATVQETIRKVKNPLDDDTRGLLDSDRQLTTKVPGNLSSNTSIAESPGPISIYQESIRSPEQWHSLYAQAAALASNSGTPKADDDSTPIMERNIRKSRKTHPPTSRYFPLASDPDSSSSKRDTSAASTSRASTRSNQYGGDSQGRRESNVSSGQSGSIRGASADRSEMTESSRGRTSSNYVTHQIRQSEDQAVTRFQDQHNVSEATTNSKARDRSDSGQRSQSRVRNSTDDTQSTARPASENSAGGAAEAEPVQHGLGEKHKPPPLQLKSTTNESFKHGRKSARSNSAVRGLKELRNATKSAFSKHSSKAESPTGSFVSASEFQNQISMRPQSSRAGSAVNENPSKPERVLGETLYSSPIIQDFALQNPSDQAPNDGLPHRQPKARSRGVGKEPALGRGNNGRGFHSRSTTDSSEDYSLNDEPSNITTPTASRPHSHKDYSPSSQEFKPRGGKTSDEKSVQNGSARVSGAVLDDAASERDSWCRTAIPMELTEDEGRMKTPTAKRSVVDFSAAKPEHPKPSMTDSNVNSSELNREPSLTRSISTPELQDLSFLPASKHQSLARPLKGKGKGVLGKKGNQASVPKEQEGDSPKDLVRPPPIPVTETTTKSEGTSPVSPQSSQYLQNARLNIPRAPRSPMKSGFPPAHLPHPQAGGPEPLAKMFVVCCSCKYFHDMPSKIYECMAKPDNVVKDTNLGVSGVISTSVKCPWCGHGMSTSCCTGYAAVVYLREKLH